VTYHLDDFSNIYAFPLGSVLTAFGYNLVGNPGVGSFTFATGLLERSSLIWTGIGAAVNRQGLIYGFTTDDVYTDGIADLTFNFAGSPTSVIAGVIARANGTNRLEVRYSGATGKLEIVIVTATLDTIIASVLPSSVLAAGISYRLEVTVSSLKTSAVVSATLAQQGKIIASLAVEAVGAPANGSWGLVAGGTNANTVEIQSLTLAAPVADGSDMFERLPIEYQVGDEVLGVIFAAVSPPILRADVAINNLKRQFNPQTAANSSLAWLLQQIGWYVDELLTPYAMRRILLRVAGWRRRYGRAGVMEEIVQEYFRLDPVDTPLSIVVAVRGETDGGFRFGKARMGKARMWQHFSRNALRITVTSAGSLAYTTTTHQRLYRLLRQLLPAWCAFELIGV
jgi:hypothetical protein